MDLFLLVSTRFYRESGKTKRKKSDSEIRKKPSSRFSDCFFIFIFFSESVVVGSDFTPTRFTEFYWVSFFFLPSWKMTPMDSEETLHLFNNNETNKEK